MQGPASLMDTVAITKSWVDVVIEPAQSPIGTPQVTVAGIEGSESKIAEGSTPETAIAWMVSP